MSIFSGIYEFTQVTLDTALDGEGCDLSTSCDTFSKLLQVKSLQGEFDKTNAMLGKYYATLTNSGDVVQAQQVVSKQLDKFSQVLDKVFVSMPAYIPSIAWTFQKSVNDFRYGFATKSAMEVGYFYTGMKVADGFLDALVDLKPFEEVEDSLAAAKASFVEYSAVYALPIIDLFALQASQNRLTNNLVQLQKAATKILSKISNSYAGDFQDYVTSEDARLGEHLDSSSGRYIDFLNQVVMAPNPYLADVPLAFPQDLTQLGVRLDALMVPAMADVAERDFPVLLGGCTQAVVVEAMTN